MFDQSFPDTPPLTEWFVVTQPAAVRIDREGALKRGFDLIVASLLLVAALPAFLVIAALIKLTSPGPVLFRQHRRGLNNTTFRIFKFRTMYHRDRDPDCRSQSHRNDRRVTPVGRVLRRYSLDELPQILNVIVGDMSLVGPRPHAPGTAIDNRTLPEILPDYLLRYQVKPGITGWAQVSGYRGILETHQQLSGRLELDLYYIHHRSFWFDLKILLKTLTCVTSGTAW